MHERVNKIFNNIDENIDKIIIKNSSEPFIDKNFFYVTGLQKGIYEGCIAVLHNDGNIDLIVSELEAESAKKSDADLNVYKSKNEFTDILNRIIPNQGNIGLNYDSISYSDFIKIRKQFEKLNLLDVSKAIKYTRLIKDKFEIEFIRKACKIVDKVVEKIPILLTDGMKEFEIAAEIDYLMQKNGAEKPAFETISSFGKNSAEPHYTHGNTKIKQGDFALFDFGACFKKYNSDITRTFIFNKADEKKKDIYHTVLEAQKIGFDNIREGVISKDIHHAVSSYIDKSKYKGCFIHSTGHSLGLSVHDGGAGFTEQCEIELKENMVFTVEPGIYLPGFGGVRIEDDILVKKDGIELLTKSARNLVEI